MSKRRTLSGGASRQRLRREYGRGVVGEKGGQRRPAGRDRPLGEIGLRQRAAPIRPTYRGDGGKDPAISSPAGGVTRGGVSAGMGGAVGGAATGGVAGRADSEGEKRGERREYAQHS